jgi:hypothetical protein
MRLLAMFFVFGVSNRNLPMHREISNFLSNVAGNQATK